ncbi:MAG: exo-alpha-sialidase [Acidobacteria bacterium]|nr:exo-alpha-sialidase [Acidobacteriota bacterium]MCW5970901.1 exo-alpha-sialidase [Blastocatellales bacterium]
MKNKPSYILAGLLVAAVMATATARPGGGYVFEESPRAVLTELGAGASRHGKLLMRTSNLYMPVVYGADRNQAQFGLALSSDFGDSFESLTPISEPGAVVSSHGENSPTLAINGIEFYALWEQNNSQGGTDLMFARSLRFGRKFHKPIKVTDKATPSSNAFSNLAVAPNGDLYAVWLDGRDPEHTQPGSSHVYFTKSTDKGATWSRNLPIAGNVCPCCRPAVAFGAAGEVFVAWRNVDGEDMRDMKISVSRDHGATFSDPVFISRDNWKISGCPHTGPQFAVRGKRLYVAWHSDAESTNAGIRLAWSDDSGRSFSRPVIVSGGVLDTNHPSMSLSEDGRLLLVFQGREPAEKEGWGAVRPFLVEIDEKGKASPPIVVPGSRKTASFPAVLAGTVGRTFVAWTEATDRGVQVVLVRGRRR